MILRVIAFSLLILHFLVPPAGAERIDLAPQRLLFQAAEAALNRNDMIFYRAALLQLEDYPLYPYLIHQELQRRLNTASTDEIAAFLNTWPDTPLADQLRSRWLIRLASEKRWQAFLDYYTPSDSTVMQCRYTQALLHTGRQKEALVLAEGLWLNGASQPQECDDVFAAWRRAGRLTPQLLWERTALSLEEGQTGMVRFLRSLHSAPDQQRLDHWQALINRPGTVARQEWLDPDHFMTPRLMAIVFRRLTRQDTARALESWRQLQARGFDRLRFGVVEQDLALYLALRFEPEALRVLENLPDALQTPQLREWRLRVSLQRADWPAVLRAFEALNPEQQQAPRWRYWKARALEESDPPGTVQLEMARRLYAELAGDMNYYGLLAADRTQIQYPLTTHFNPFQIDTRSIEAVPAVQRARELLKLDRIVPARREWIRLTGAMPPSDRALAAVVAWRWEWYDRAIFTAAATSEAAQFWNIRFPMPYRNLVLHYASQRHLDPAVIYAVIRQESAFMVDARSPAGALGLMQIMPATGNSIARSLNEPLPHSGQLLDPERNIRFGTFYLQRRLHEMGYNLVLAAASYNAGSSRVRSWLPAQKAVASDIWVETLPFFETRDYIQRIITYTAIYNQQLGRPAIVVSTLMPAIQPPQRMAATTGN